MPFRIQRTPLGLSNLLSLFGGQTPAELEDRVRGVVELLQFYGQTQLQTLTASNAALAENGIITLTPQATSWCVLFSVSCVITKTATVTALEAVWNKGPIASAAWLASTGSMGPFGATETGAAQRGFRFPYPLLLPPATPVNFVLSILGTDANANCSVTAEFGVLG